MTTYDFTHLTFLAINDEVLGKSKLQKIVYFLGILTGSTENLGFQPHFYGPYSDEVGAALNRLKSLGFVAEYSMQNSMRESEFEHDKYGYKLTDDGMKIAREKASSNPKTWSTFEGAAKQLKKAVEIHRMELSLASKSYFMLRQQGKDLTSYEISESSKISGRKVGQEEILNLVSFLKELNLLKSSIA